MADLADYERKRSFDRTPEPGADSNRAGAPGDRPRFVIQEHSARRLHWDLRLEQDGVLRSWALPRGLPHDPEQNRLAVATEDHPLEYLDFEGTIPEGNYGAGEMRIVDRGHYEPERVEEGKVVLVLAGARIRGRYSIFRTDGKDWLVHRMDPPDPDRTALPERVRPTLAVEADDLPAEGEWAYEIDWRGRRTFARLAAGRLELLDTEDEDLRELAPELRDLNRQLGIRDALLDGVLTVLDERGRPSPERLEARLEPASESTIRRRAAREPLTLVIFDLLHLDGADLRDRPLRERRQRLEDLGLEGPAWRTSSIHLGDGAALLAAAAEQGVEAIVAKELDSTYEPGSGGRWHRVPVPRRT